MVKGLTKLGREQKSKSNDYINYLSMQIIQSRKTKMHTPFKYQSGVKLKYHYNLLRNFEEEDFIRL